MCQHHVNVKVSEISMSMDFALDDDAEWTRRCIQTHVATMRRCISSDDLIHHARFTLGCPCQFFTHRLVHDFSLAWAMPSLTAIEMK
eukprot:785927-Amphidinium_carterae.2